jgi:hypothetical protein
MYRIIILSCSLPEKKDELGVLAIFLLFTSIFIGHASNPP